ARVTRIFLNSNQLSGTIPNFNMPKLQPFLFSIQLSGTIPNFNHRIVRPFLNSNQLSGQSR
ncbi:MAG: hypothetical protein U5L45_00470, partial [Saprospiraceae bacterium]|nr:hypothetical protein [Saprospiraceae bacterium]